MVAIAPWLETDLEAPWLTKVFATDASMEGFGVAETYVTIEEIAAEAKYTETKGWLVCMNDVYDTIEEAVWQESGDHVHEDSFEMTRASRQDGDPERHTRIFRAAHLFSGRRRKGDQEWWLLSLAASFSVADEVWSIDLSVDPDLDLSSDSFLNIFLAAIAGGFFHEVVAGPPCGTWSKARFNTDVLGPRPLRTRAQPWGRTDIRLTESEARQL